MHAAALLLLSALPALGADLTGKLVGNKFLNLTSLPVDSRVDLDFGAGSTLFRADGSFELFDVSPGQHVVRSLVPGFAVSPLLVTIPAEGLTDLPHVQTFYVDKAPLPTTSPSLGYPLEISANQPYEFFTPPPGMNVIAMFKSPMMLMMLFSAVMAIALPKITASMEEDPEVKAEMDAQRRRMVNGDWRGLLSGNTPNAPNRHPWEKAPGQSAAGPSGSAPAAVNAGAAPAVKAASGGSTPARGGQGKRGGKRK